MKVCMLVHNSVSRDRRVLKEAHSLQMAGHSVTIIGVPDQETGAPLEYLSDGVRVIRVLWQARAYRMLLTSVLLRALPVLALLAFAIWGIFALTRWLFGANGVVFAAWPKVLDAVQIALHPTFLGGAYAIAGVAIAVLMLLLIRRLLRDYVGVFFTSLSLRRSETETQLRYAEILSKDRSLGGVPRLGTRIPSWMPDFILELIFEPLSWIAGQGVGRLTLQRFRGKQMAEIAIQLKPDVIHCHDCLTLPTGARIKRSLGIPLVYDAHEIYDAANSRMIGISDYYVHIHRRYLPKVDKFITINDSIALYYRLSYPEAVPATVIRNATARIPAIEYDGRLHAAADLPRSQKILLYQGGYTLGRGLRVLVRAATLLPKGWTLVMMGWGPLAAELKQIAATMAQRAGGFGEPKVRFVPAAPQSELHLWTAGGTVGVIPYQDKFLNHWFCTPNKLWEFPVAGVPIIVQPFPELRRVVETYGCGWVLPSALTPSAIANIVAGLTDEAVQLAKQGCRQFVEADSWEPLYEGRLVSLYSGLEAVDTARVGSLQPASVRA
jgi:glycosyltransferase involved in cell wall biosynthesis